ncbi:MlaC/ttg2D family ABC transporter substrate-binding protein [Halopseudomonas salegens]|uniref:Phospholipid transport system substrate-binding protein n=1 Tax=Halopseudomonas salegens TaxID=1434072 RepID=A0A1H2EB46_9GAMM|nr:ABC transporter substrate-binding protein [Halopseudomonas salegens]SDT92360.1 phospholipid transport system substrate-binding protein [Halopseudomonas salegens]
MRSLINYSFALLLLLPLFAQAGAKSAQAVVDDTASQIMTLLNENRDAYRDDTDALVRDLSDVLDPVVDFQGFARSVMTVRYSRNASQDQINRFIDSFKSNIAEFYGSALLEANGGELTVLEPRDRDQQGPDRTMVHMDIVSPSGDNYRASYTMVKIDGQWKVRNVVVEGFNVGLLFRDLFAQAMQDKGNDLDAVIADWGSVIAASREEIEQEVEE